MAGAVEPSRARAKIESLRAKPTANLTAYDLDLRLLLDFFTMTEEGYKEAFVLLHVALDCRPSPGRADNRQAGRGGAPGRASHPPNAGVRARSSPTNCCPVLPWAESCGVYRRGPPPRCGPKRGPRLRSNCLPQAP